MLPTCPLPYCALIRHGALFIAKIHSKSNFKARKYYQCCVESICTPLNKFSIAGRGCFVLSPCLQSNCSSEKRMNYSTNLDFNQNTSSVNPIQVRFECLQQPKVKATRYRSNPEFTKLQVDNNHQIIKHITFKIMYRPSNEASHHHHC